jgi:obscurin-RhoGEF protein
MYFLIHSSAAEEIKFIRELEDVKVKESNVTATLSCEISKKGLKVDWYKGDKKLRRDDKYNITIEDETVHKLIIENVTTQEAGEYKAVYDKLETSATVSVAGMMHNAIFSLKYHLNAM